MGNWTKIYNETSQYSRPLLLRVEGCRRKSLSQTTSSRIQTSLLPKVQTPSHPILPIYYLCRCKACNLYLSTVCVNCKVHKYVNSALSSYHYYHLDILTTLALDPHRKDPAILNSLYPDSWQGKEKIYILILGPSTHFKRS